jgi:crotonobetainyl-CoA:carnitine CoA-transferase CaiB-like acyl-CoA transferase
MAGMLLAELGADVTKVESPDGPDFVRSGGLNPHPDGVNPTFYSLNRGKRFCAVNAKRPEGRELLTRLAASADVFLHNIRPGKPEELGVGYEELRAINPRLIYVAISGYGPDGPEAHLPAYDYAVQAKIGMVDYQRNWRSGHSDLVHQVVVDKVTAMGAVQAVLAALYSREKTGRGQRVDVPMMAAGLSFLWPDGFATAHSEHQPAIPLDQIPPWLEYSPSSNLVVLPTTDGEIATGILLPPWDGLCLALDRVDLITDERFSEQMSRVMNLPALIDEIAGEVAKYSTADVLARFAEHDFAAGEVASRRTVHQDSTVQALNLISDQNPVGLGTVRQPAPMWTFSDSTTVLTTTVGYTGYNSRAVLGELGLDDDEIDRLIDDGVVSITTEIDNA